MKRLKDPAEIRRIARKSLFEELDGLCEGAIVVDRDARIVWISDKYAARLGLASPGEAEGRVVEEVIPNSLMREVVRTGEPMLLDIMQFGAESFVVMRVPINDDRGRVVGAVGFMLFDRLRGLEPFVTKFQRLERQLAAERRVHYTFSNYLGSSPAAMEVKRHARRAAQSDATVLLLGETGTGKEVIAQAIHAASPRARGPFVAVNMAASPDVLDHALRADGGTLFLDEVGDMSPELQASLLRVLQEKEVELPGEGGVRRVDVRVIAAASADLRQMASMGRFRSDLYYRLSVLPIALPSLRERLGDLEMLAEHILEDIALRAGRAPRELTPAALAVLASHPWPGNLHELKSVLEQVTLDSEEPRLDAEDFTLVLPRVSAAPRGSERATLRLADVVADAERTAIRSALAAADGKKVRAAELLGISRATLYQKLSELADPRERSH